MMNLFPLELRNFLEEISNIGLNLCLVGGSVRDFFLNGQLNQDLDFEIRPTNIVTDLEWEELNLQIIKLLDFKKINYEKLPYAIIRTHFLNYSLEFSSPRMEIFEKDNFSHHNFKASLNPLLSYQESFKRRDFTINAIGLELDFSKNEFNLIDPYLGKNDLSLSLLRNIDEDFFKDPVRFLRMIRFKVNLDFQIDKYLLMELGDFNLIMLSDHYFLKELSRSDLGLFLNEFVLLVNKFDIVLNSKFHFLKKINFYFPKKLIKDFIDILIYVYANQKELSKECSILFKINEKKLKEIGLVFEAISFLNENGLKIEESIEIHQFVNLNEVIHLKYLIEHQEIFFQIKKVLNLKDMAYEDYFIKINSIEVTNDELMSFAPTHRSFYKFYKMFIKEN